MVAGFHYSHSNDIKYERCPGFKSHLIFVSFTFCNLKWVLRISRYMQLLPQYLTRNRFSASWQRCTALWWRKEKWRDIPLRSMVHHVNPFWREERISLKKKKSKEQQTLIFPSLSSPEIICEMKGSETKSSGKRNPNTNPVPSHVQFAFHALKNSLQPWALVAEARQWGSGNPSCQSEALAFCWLQKK